MDASLPTLVHLKREHGEVVQGCQVYIGNAIDNSSWRLKQSKWHNPFHNKWDVDAKTRMKMYRDYIISNPNLQHDLPSLKGKVLGCLCKDMSTCHGNVLIDLVKCRTEHGHVHKHVRGNLYFFKGSLSPLSNFYPCALTAKLVTNPVFGKKVRYPLGSHQMYAHKMALKVRANILAEKILNAQTTLELLELNKTIPRVEMSVEDQVVQMFHIQSQKFKNCQALRKKMRKLSKQKTIPCEATRNKFWGSGVDLSDLHRDTPDTPTGRNLLGWILSMVHAKRESDFYWSTSNLPESLMEGFVTVRRILAERGLVQYPLHTDRNDERSQNGQQRQELFSGGGGGSGRERVAPTTTTSEEEDENGSADRR